VFLAALHAARRLTRARVPRRQAERRKAREQQILEKSSSWGEGAGLLFEATRIKELTRSTAPCFIDTVV
jgi:hypothetical protein